MRKRKLLLTLFVMALVIGAVGSVYADSGILSTWRAAYPTSASSSFSCSLCHTSAPALNGYGQAALDANLNFISINSQDSDGDGATNIAEITAGTNPGSASSKPAPTPVACTGYAYSAWSTCGSNGQQTRTVTGNTPSGCTGTPSASPVLTQACTPAPVACTGYTYSAWSTCGSNGQQTRTVTGNTPSGCTGTPSASPALTQACTPAPVACTGYTYSDWSSCGSNGQQTRTVAANTPAGCTGTPSSSPVLTQACTPSTVACTSFTYGNWTECDSTGHQTRTATGVPAGCTGTADPGQLTQICNYVPPVTPPPTNGTMPVPASEQVFSYQPVELPLVSSDPAQAEPIGVGSVATGGDTVDVKVNIGPFEGPVNVSLVVYAPALDFDDLYFMRGNDLKLLSEAVDEDSEGSDEDNDSDDQEDGHDSHRSHNFGKLVTWKHNVTGVNENVYTGPVSDLPSGLYTLVLVVKSQKDNDHSYRWVTHITIP